jgi:5-methyltetrahydrofolate corrinoid/iron sulfur protein methyltransferase
MFIIGENIHIVSEKVKEALTNRDRGFFIDSAVKQVEAGAKAIDINLGPRKKDWAEVFPWIIEAIESVVDVPLSIDTTNLDGMEAALKSITKAQPFLNSMSTEVERLEKVPLLAKKYGAKVIALTMGADGIPGDADARVNLAVETLIPRAMEVGLPIQDLIIDPLVLTTSGCQQYCPQLIEVVRMLQFVWDPAPLVSIGLSNVSNAVPNENRPLINRVYLAMMMGSGLKMMIANPLDRKQNEVIRWIEEGDTSTPLAKAYNSIAQRVQENDEPQIEDFDLSDPEQAAVWKTTQILLNKIIYADSYLSN